MQYAVPIPQLPTLSVAGRDERFPVNRIFCVGRNYAAHAREMGSDPDRECLVASHLRSFYHGLWESSLGAG